MLLSWAKQRHGGVRLERSRSADHCRRGTGGRILGIGGVGWGVGVQRRWACPQAWHGLLIPIALIMA